MAKPTIVIWTCPDCGRVNETVCSGDVTGAVVCRECGKHIARVPVYYKHISTGCNGSFELFVPNIGKTMDFRQLVCGVCGSKDITPHFKRFFPELTLTDTTLTTTTATMADISTAVPRLVVEDSRGNTLAELAAGEQRTFGRGRMADVHLATVDTRVSRVHFTLSRDDSGATTLSVDGRNGLFLNGGDLRQGAVESVGSGDEIIVYDETIRLI